MSAFANNGDFILNVIENMIGGAVLSDLRGKGISWKPFVKISELERKAEEKFLSEEQALAEKLGKMENKIQQLTKNNENESDVLSPQTIKAIEGFKSEMMTTRAELRNVKFNLRRDVENLKSTIMFINIGLLPTIVAALALLIALRRPRNMNN